MVAPFSHQSSLNGGRSQDSLDDAEKGMYDSTVELTAPLPFVYMPKRAPPSDAQLLSSPTSPVHEGITPFSSVPELSLSWPPGRKAIDANVIKSEVRKPEEPKKPKKKVSRWILLDLWFNTYRKFFTFVTLLNLTGIILAACGRFKYAENHLGALVLGNLLTAILMRNELWMRFLYMVAIYGLRGVCIPYFASFIFYVCISLIGNVADQDPFVTTSGPRCASSTPLRRFCSMSVEFIRDVPSPVRGKPQPICPMFFWLCAGSSGKLTLKSVSTAGWCTRSSTSFGTELCSTMR